MWRDSGRNCRPNFLQGTWQSCCNNGVCALSAQSAVRRLLAGTPVNFGRWTSPVASVNKSYPRAGMELLRVAYARRYRSEIASPLRSAATISPAWRPASVSTAPF
jgi:hypothetical protein